jgi:hypothetical protein
MRFYINFLYINDKVWLLITFLKKQNLCLQLVQRGKVTQL